MDALPSPPGSDNGNEGVGSTPYRKEMDFSMNNKGKGRSKFDDNTSQMSGRSARSSYSMRSNTSTGSKMKIN